MVGAKPCLMTTAQEDDWRKCPLLNICLQFIAWNRAAGVDYSTFQKAGNAARDQCKMPLHAFLCYQVMAKASYNRKLAAHSKDICFQPKAPKLPKEELRWQLAGSPRAHQWIRWHQPFFINLAVQPRVITGPSMHHVLVRQKDPLTCPAQDHHDRQIS